MAREFCYLIGNPIGHSISPAMHNAAFKYLNLDYEYALLEVKPEKLNQAVEELRATNIAGFNVTIPYKEKIIPLLHQVDSSAKKMGAVNTVKNQNGKLIGYNTDGHGFVASLKEDAGFDPEMRRVVLLGAGGAGRAIAVSLVEKKVKSLIIIDPQSEKLDELINYIFSLLSFKAEKSGNLQKDIDSADLLVNASPVGMHPKINASPIPEAVKLHPKLLVYDIIYNPEKTMLLKQAERAGAKAVSGLGMLVRQGALAFTIFTGKPAPINIMFKAANSALKR